MCQPENTIDNPMLIVFSDASEDAFGTHVYVRWKCSDGSTTNLFAAKGKVAPIRLHRL